jgi:Ca-activated chloride channel family protein
MSTRLRTVASWFAAIAGAWSAVSYSLQASGDTAVGQQSIDLSPGAASVQVHLVSPAHGALVTGPTMLRAEVDPAAAASSAVFFVDGRELCRRTDPPFECEWDAGGLIVSHQVRLVVNLRAGGRIVRTAHTGSVAYSEAVEVDVVQVTATVTDGDGRYVKGLPRSAFQVFEDGKAQPLTHFYSDDAPLELVVALDLSDSMRPALAGMKHAVTAFLTTLPTRHRLTLLGFNDEVFTLLPSGADAADRAQVVERLSAWGRTSLYEAVLQAVEMLSSRPGRKAIIVFTDGEDQGSRVTIQQVEHALQSSDSILYMIGQGQGVVIEKLQQVMDRLSLRTGGRTVATTRIDALQSAFHELFEEISHQYVLGYHVPGGSVDDRWREIGVKVDGNYKVRARHGYRMTRN